MEQKLYEKIGKQEMMIEALKSQLAEVSSLVSRFISGEEKPGDWEVSPQGQLVKKEQSSAQSTKPVRRKK